MQTVVSEESALDGKIRELCQVILDDSGFASARDKIETFMTDAKAKDTYRAWQEKGNELHRMGHEGLKPNDADLESFQSLKDAVMENPVAADFIESENHLNDLFRSVTKQVQVTLQLGRLPLAEDLEESGCCGGGGSGGCGCG